MYEGKARENAPKDGPTVLDQAAGPKQVEVNPVIESPQADRYQLSQASLYHQEKILS